MQKYLDMALELGAVNAKLISPDQVFFDKRARLKCRFGCNYDGRYERYKCGNRGVAFEDAREAIRNYEHILLVHNHNAHQLSRMVIKLERQAFLDGHYWAFALRTCHYCKKCTAETEKGCANPSLVRPCEQALGIDVYKTVRELGLECRPLLDRDDTQNRYGFVLLN